MKGQSQGGNQGFGLEVNLNEMLSNLGLAVTLKTYIFFMRGNQLDGIVRCKKTHISNSTNPLRARLVFVLFSGTV